jgi:preprotein translocase subunit SecF
MGAGTLKDISLALLIGIIAGTYSSVFLAPPLLVLLRSRDKAVIAQAAAVAKARSRAGQHGGTAATPRVTAISTTSGSVSAVAASSSTTSTGTARTAPTSGAGGRGPRNQPKRSPKRNRGRR